MNALERHVLEIIGEDTTSPDVFVDTDAGMEPIRDSINDAIEEISMLVGAMKITYRIPLRSGQTFYRFKFNRDRFAYVTDAWLVSQKRRLIPTDFYKLKANDPRWMTVQGSPENYFNIGTNIVGFYPSPSGATDVVELKCAAIPDRYTSDTDRVKLRDSFKWAVVHYAVGEYFASRGDRNEALTHQSKYMEHLGIQDQYPDAKDRIFVRASK